MEKQRLFKTLIGIRTVCPRCFFVIIAIPKWARPFRHVTLLYRMQFNDSDPEEATTNLLVFEPPAIGFKDVWGQLTVPAGRS